MPLTDWGPGKGGNPAGGLLPGPSSAQGHRVRACLRGNPTLPYVPPRCRQEALVPGAFSIQQARGKQSRPLLPWPAPTPAASTRRGWSGSDGAHFRTTAPFFSLPVHEGREGAPSPCRSVGHLTAISWFLGFSPLVGLARPPSQLFSLACVPSPLLPPLNVRRRTFPLVSGLEVNRHTLICLLPFYPLTPQTGRTHPCARSGSLAPAPA